MSGLPLYRVIMNTIIERIESGVYAVNDMVPSESEIEKEFKVSNITARRALNELANLGLISRVKGGGSYVRALPSDAPPESSASGKMISLLMPFDRSAGRGTDLICGASDFLYQNGYYLNVVNCHDNYSEERYALDHLTRQSKGLIFYPREDSRNLDMLYQLVACNYPLVTVDKAFNCEGGFSVTANNVQGAYDLTKHLIDKGHRDICFVSHAPVDMASSIRDRFIGFCRAMNDHGIEIQTSNYISGFSRYFQDMPPGFSNTPEESKILFDKIAHSLLQSDTPPTAVFAINDGIAQDLMKAYLSRGVRVPEDVSIAGFDNLPFGEYLDPSLTTVDQDFYSMGKKAAEMVVAICENQQLGPRQIALPTRLIERNSTAAKRTSARGARGTASGNMAV